MRHIGMSGLPGSIIPRYLINGKNFGKKLLDIKSAILEFLSKFCLKHFSFYEELSEI